VSRLPFAIAMLVALAAGLTWLQGRFDGSDARNGIKMALRYKPDAAGSSVFDALVARGEGEPRCDGELVSRLWGDVRVSCVNPRRPEVAYTFRVLVGGNRPPKGESPAAQALLEEVGRASAAAPAQGAGAAAGR
jgi:hypothetical protein